MFKSNKWLYFLLSIPFLLLFLTFLSYGNFLLNNNGRFVHEHEKTIKSALITYLEDEERQSIKSLKILPNSARGGYDNGGSYHIQFSAYVNDNPKQSLKAELYFPDASISPFSLINPSPFKDKKKKMSRWFIGKIELSDDPYWRKE
ncbi:hypothetical protein D8857_06145 [Streptococcus oralis]|uniref:Uncharacterized protein n=1 Tax=Streptococcus oralis TaxID=1303 RepID=A0A428C287_STROR|nr:hypothetical protein [Streptococcus oralis]RSI72160.1 hypothetical protein D8857_06145 [Streptococcus oralis]